MNISSLAKKQSKESFIVALWTNFDTLWFTSFHIINETKKQHNVCEFANILILHIVSLLILLEHEEHKMK